MGVEDADLVGDGCAAAAAAARLFLCPGQGSTLWWDGVVGCDLLRKEKR